MQLLGIQSPHPSPDLGCGVFFLFFSGRQIDLKTVTDKIYVHPSLKIRSKKFDLILESFDGRSLEIPSHDTISG